MMMCRPGDSRASGIQVDATSIADADGLRRVARHHGCCHTASTRRDAHCCVDGARRHLNIIICSSNEGRQHSFDALAPLLWRTSSRRSLQFELCVALALAWMDGK